jgi:hypothetical protein
LFQKNVQIEKPEKYGMQCGYLRNSTVVFFEYYERGWQYKATDPLIKPRSVQHFCHCNFG